MPKPVAGALPAAIQRTHLVALYAAFLRASSRFASYNFRSYFLRHAHRKFREQLPIVLGTAPSTHVHPLSPAGSLSPPTPPECSVDAADPHVLRDWYAEAKRELAVLERASIMNRLFEAPPLVVEGAAKIMATGGGGAGMEQAAGGAGQPDQAGDTITSPPPDPSKGF